MISTHILDTSVGSPAAAVMVDLQKDEGGKWESLAVEKTNADGRIVFNAAVKPGSYRLVFHIQKYFEGQGKEAFFLDATVAFKIADIARKYHVPLLLNPFGYSTYRGS